MKRNWSEGLLLLFCIYSTLFFFPYGTSMLGDVLAATFFTNLIVQNRANPGRVQSLWSSHPASGMARELPLPRLCGPIPVSSHYNFCLFFCLIEGPKIVWVVLLQHDTKIFLDIGWGTLAGGIRGNEEVCWADVGDRNRKPVQMRHKLISTRR